MPFVEEYFQHLYGIFHIAEHTAVHNIGTINQFCRFFVIFFIFKLFKRRADVWQIRVVRNYVGIYPNILHLSRTARYMQALFYVRNAVIRLARTQYLV